MEMTLLTTSERRFVLKGYEIVNASKAYAAEPMLAETTQTIIIEEEDEEIDDTKRENKFRAITSILTDCLKHRKLEAFKWHTDWEAQASWTRPAEFWEALTKDAPNLTLVFTLTNCAE